MYKRLRPNLRQPLPPKKTQAYPRYARMNRWHHDKMGRQSLSADSGYSHLTPGPGSRDVTSDGGLESGILKGSSDSAARVLLVRSYNRNPDLLSPMILQVDPKPSTP